MIQDENKIIRTICYFTQDPTPKTVKSIDELAKALIDNGFQVQTKRICSNSIEAVLELDKKFANESYIFSAGSLLIKEISENFDKLLKATDTSFNINLTDEEINLSHTQVLFDVIRRKPGKTFNFTYVFNNQPETPYFPSASYKLNGFSVGMQPTDLSEGCQTVEEWLNKMQQCWEEILAIFKNRNDFLGIDSSIAPLFTGKSSLIGFIKNLGYDFSQSTTTDVYLKITKFIKGHNPKAIGLCGLMLPCLEDFELADEYEKGNFSIERNIYLSLHSGLGIDTYPVGIDEKPERVREILKLIQGLSNKYNKPLSVRFVSDGKAKIDEKTDFRNQYLKDVTIRAL